MKKRKLKTSQDFFCGTIFLTAIGIQVAIPPLAVAQPSLCAAVEQAHAQLWGRYVDRNGVILDYVGEIPTPDDCAVGRPNAIGWWSPIENGPMFTGLYLPAACERARRSGDAVDKANARRLAQGLLKCASVSDVPGFIARGMGTDGKCHYPLGSDDQTHPWFYGLHAYVVSGIPSEVERKQIAEKMKEVADVLESFRGNVPVMAPSRASSGAASKVTCFATPPATSSCSGPCMT